MDKRTLTAVFISMGILVAWQALVMRQQPAMPVAQQSAVHATTAASTAQSGAAEAAKSAAPTSAGMAKKEEALRIDDSKLVVSNDSGMIQDWVLENFKRTGSEGQVSLSDVTLVDSAVQMAFDSTELKNFVDVRGDLKRDGSALVWSYADSKVKVVRRLTVPEGQHYLDVDTHVDFLGAKPEHAFLMVQARAKGEKSADVDRKLIYWADGAMEAIPLGKEVEFGYAKAATQWIGTMNRYFTIAVLPKGDAVSKAVFQPIAGGGRLSLAFPVNGNSFSLPYRVYFGPKRVEILKEVDPTLTATVNFGWVQFFAFPLLKLMKWLYRFVQNYGVAIILLTLLMRGLTYPLTYKSMKNMRQMAKINPQLQKLREKYKDDREALNREMMVLMRNAGYNPVAGCLPMFVQLPVFFALYRVLYGAVELYQAPFMLWIHDLSQKDPFYITPVLLTVTMFIQQKVTPNATADPAQQKIMQFMPLIFGVMMINLPSGLTLYMLVSALAGIAQQFVLNRKLSINVAPEPARAR